MGEEVEGVKEPEKKNAYHQDLEPGVEVRVPQWNLILISNIPIGVDFYHTDMLEKVITIEGRPVQLEKKVKE